jgi:hypothetical protein
MHIGIGTVLIIVIALGLLWGLYIYLSREEEEEYYYDDEEPRPQRIYDSSGTLIFGQQDDTADVDSPQCNCYDCLERRRREAERFDESLDNLDSCDCEECECENPPS